MFGTYQLFLLKGSAKPDRLSHFLPQVVHDLYAEGGAAVGPVGEAFPGCVVNGAVDRGLLGQQVLGKSCARRARGRSRAYIS